MCAHQETHTPNTFYVVQDWKESVTLLRMSGALVSFQYRARIDMRTDLNRSEESDSVDFHKSFRYWDGLHGT